jgi:5,10-methylenetetrahydrofolate reductase
MAKLRMSSLLAAALVESRAGLPAIAHLTCRDRNSLALQAELLGAHALGLRRVLCLQGDPVERGDHPMAKPVFEIGSDALIQLIGHLNQSRNWSGKPLEAATHFTAVAACNPYGDPEHERRRYLEKREAGAELFQAQPVFAAEDALRYRDLVGEGPPILFGVLPLRSRQAAERMRSWTKVPEVLLHLLERGGAQAGRDWTAQLIGDLWRAGLPGIHLYPMGHLEELPALLQEISL